MSNLEPYEYILSEQEYSGHAYHRYRPYIQALHSEGYLQVVEGSYVLCVHQTDGDALEIYDEDCKGKVYLTPGEKGEVLNCPECRRLLYPYEDKKHQFPYLKTSFNHEKIRAYLLEQLGTRCVVVEEGVYRILSENDIITVCILEYCNNPFYTSLEYIRSNLTLLITLDSAALQWIEKHPAVYTLTLAELVSNATTLTKKMAAMRIQGLPALVPQHMTPLYKGYTLPLTLPYAPALEKKKHFHLQVRTESILLNEVVIIPHTAMSRFRLFNILFEQYWLDTQKRVPRAQYTVLSPQAVAKQLSIYQGEVDIDQHIRRPLNKLQHHIVETFLSTTGEPIDRNDVIEMLPWQGQEKSTVYGYRLNPHYIAVEAI